MPFDPRPVTPWARPRVLWFPDVRLETMRLKKPTMLLAAASPAEVGKWRQANKWADTIPIVTFIGDDRDRWVAVDAVQFGPPDPTNPLTPYVVDNPPAPVYNALAQARDIPYSDEERNAMGRYISAVEAVAQHGPPGPWWWIMAESDDGAGAVRCAATRGGCVALVAKGRQMGLVGAALANRLGIDVAVQGVIARGRS